jgi:hypothetical protein
MRTLTALLFLALALPAQAQTCPNCPKETKIPQSRNAGKCDPVAKACDCGKACACCGCCVTGKCTCAPGACFCPCCRPPVSVVIVVRPGGVLDCSRRWAPVHHGRRWR